MRRPRDDSHPEGESDSGDLLPESTDADETERLASEAGRDAGLPAAGDDRVVLGEETTGEGEDEAPGLFDGRGGRVVAGDRARDGDPKRAGCFNVEACLCTGSAHGMGGRDWGGAKGAPRFLIPVVEMKRRFGSRSRTSLGNFVRSRMAWMIVKSCSVATSSQRGIAEVKTVFGSEASGAQSA